MSEHNGFIVRFFDETQQQWIDVLPTNNTDEHGQIYEIKGTLVFVTREPLDAESIKENIVAAFDLAVKEIEDRILFGDPDVKEQPIGIFGTSKATSKRNRGKQQYECRIASD